MRPAVLSFMVVLAAACAPGVAAAQAAAPVWPGVRPPRTMRLELTRGPGAKRCPPEVLLHEEMGRRLGYDPFSADAPARLTVKLYGDHGTFNVDMEFFDTTGASEWTRTFTGSVDCHVLILSIADHVRYRYLLAGVFDTSASSPPPPEAPASPPPITPTPSPPPEAPPSHAVVVPPAPPAPARTYRIRIGADAIFSPILTRSGSAGVAPWVALRLREPEVSIEVGMRATWSVVPFHDPITPIRAAYVSGIVAACRRWGSFSGCPVVEVGSMSFRSGDAQVQVQNFDPLVVAIGVRGSFERAVAEHLAFRALIELEGVAKAAHFRDHGPQPDQPVGGTRALSVTLGLGFATDL